VADRTQRAAAARRSPVVRLLYDTEGDLRARRVILIIAALVVLIVLGTIVVSVIGVATDPNVLAAGAVIIFLAIKLPLLALVWWLMTRHQERPGDQAWTGRERREILEYLERQARESVGRTDAVSRLSYLSREAWHVADTAPDEERAQAVSVAVAIAGLRAQAQAASRRGD
jgi:hypothetical protein